MKVYQRKMVKVDIGDVEHSKRLPMRPRNKSGMKTVCDACLKRITEEFFIAGFKAGHKNMFFHEKCFKSNKELTND